MIYEFTELEINKTIESYYISLDPLVLKVFPAGLSGF